MVSNAHTSESLASAAFRHFGVDMSERQRIEKKNALECPARIRFARAGARPGHSADLAEHLAHHAIEIHRCPKRVLLIL